MNASQSENTLGPVENSSAENYLTENRLDAEDGLDKVELAEAKTAKGEAAHRTAGLVYCLWLLGILFGVTAVIGVLINHTKLASVRGTHAHSHFIWQIASFWLVFAGVVFCFVLWPRPIAQIIAFASVFVWLFSALIGSWYLSKSRRLSFIARHLKADPPVQPLEALENAVPENEAVDSRPQQQQQIYTRKINSNNITRSIHHD